MFTKEKLCIDLHFEVDFESVKNNTLAGVKVGNGCHFTVDNPPALSLTPVKRSVCHPIMGLFVFLKSLLGKLIFLPVSLHRQYLIVITAT